MPTRILEASFAGVSALSARFELARGVDPSRGEIVVAGERLDLRDGALTLTDGETRVTLERLVVTHAIVQDGAEGPIVTTLTLEDRRRVLGETPVFGRFNLRRADEIAFDPATISDGAPFSWRQLVEKILAAAKISELAVPELALAPENVVWTGQSAREALRDLLVFAGVDLALGVDDRLRIVDAENIEAFTAPKHAVIGRQRGFSHDAARTPGEVLVVGGATLREQTFTGAWEPIIESDGADGSPEGAIVALSAMLSAWSIADVDLRRAVLFERGFDALVTGADAETRECRTRLLERCAYRWYRAPESARAALPWLPARLVVDSAGQPAAPEVRATFFRARDRQVAKDEDPFENVATPAPVAEGYDIDMERGIVKFARVMGTLQAITPPIGDVTLEGRVLAAGAQIELTIAHEAPAASLDDVFSLRVVNPAGMDAGATAAPRLVPAPWLRLQQVRNGAVWTDQNRAALEAEARALAASAFRDTDDGAWRVQRLAGAHPASPDARRERIAWEIGESGLTTTIVERPLPAPRLVAAPRARAPRRSVAAPSAENPSRRRQNAWTRGPVILRAETGVSQAEAASFAEATTYASGSGVTSTGHLGPWRYPFFLDRAGSTFGGWHESALVKILQGGEDTIIVQECDENGVTASGSQSLQALAFAPQALREGEFGLLRETASGNKIVLGFPEFLRLVSDHARPDGDAGGFSTKVYAASGSGFDPGRFGDLDDLITVTDRVLGSGAPMLALFASGDGSGRLVRIAGATAGGFLSDVIAYRHEDRAVASGMAVRAAAPFWTGTQSVPPLASVFGGPLPFESAALTLNRQLFSGFSVVGDPPYREGRLIFDPVAESWRLLAPTTTIVASGSAGHRVASAPGANPSRWRDVLTFAAEGQKLALDQHAWLKNPATGSSAVFATIVRAGNDYHGALNLASGHAWDSRYASGHTAALSTILRVLTVSDAFGSGHFGVGLNASGLVWATSGAQGFLATRSASTFDARLADAASTTAALGYFTFASGGEGASFFRPVVPLPGAGPVLFSLTDSGSAVGGASWGGLAHYEYGFNAIFNASGGSYGGTVHNLGTSANLLGYGSRVKAWWNADQQAWWCSAPSLGAA